MSSTLCLSYLNDIENWFIENNVSSLRLGVRRLLVILFADDLAMVDKTICGLQEKLDLLKRFCDKWGVKTSVDKQR